MAGAFTIQNKVALITGGVNGIGFECAKALLKNGAKGVSLADINTDAAKNALEEIEKEFGKNKAIFVKTDVTDIAQFENAFKKTIKKYEHIDILLNNAGILDDSKWEKEIDINIKGTVHGILLGLEKYLQTHRSDNEAVLVNLSSTAGVSPFGTFPIYVGTKFAIHGMTISWGLPAHYERSKVRVVGVCPGGTLTDLYVNIKGRNLGEAYENYRTSFESDDISQTAEEAANGIIQVIENGKPGTIWVIEGGKTPYQYILPDRFEIEKKLIK